MKTGYLKTVMGLFCVLSLALACEKEIEKYGAEVVLDPITIGTDMKAAIFEVESTIGEISNEWYVTSPSEDTWLSQEIIPGTKSLWIMIDGNVDGATRSSYVQIRCKGKMQKIIVKQDCEEILKVGRSSVSFRDLGGTIAVTLTNFSDLSDIVPVVDATWCTAQIKDGAVELVASAQEEGGARRNATLTISAKRAITGKPVTKEVSISQDAFGERPSFEYSADGGQTWATSIPEVFEVLSVATNNDAKLAAIDLYEFKAAIEAQAAPAGLDLRNADYEEDLFPADVFAGASELAPNKVLKSISFPRNVTKIEARAFVYCTALESVDLTGIASLGSEAFRYSGLVNLNIPNSVTYFEQYVFADCLSLENVYFNSPWDAGTSGREDPTGPASNRLYEKWMFYTTSEEITDAKMVLTVGPDVVHLARCFLRHSNNLKTLILEDAVAFWPYVLPYCSNLETVEFRCSNASEIANSFTTGKTWDASMTPPGKNVAGANKKILVPSGLKAAYESRGIVSALIGVGYSVEETVFEGGETPEPTPTPTPTPTPEPDPVPDPMPGASTLPGTSWNDIVLP